MKILSEVEKRFPHVARNITLMWGCPEFIDYINKLIVDDRGGRQGFQTEVLDEMLFLHRLHITKHGELSVRHFESTLWR